MTINRPLLFTAAFAAACFAAPASADDNIAACEIVIQKTIITDDMSEDDKAPVMATFLPADDFIFSAFDAEDGHMTEVNGEPIRALMCTRSNVVPTEFDLPLIRTKIPVYLSQNFDSPDSSLMAISFKDGKYVFEYAGASMDEDDLASLDERLKSLNEDVKAEDEP